ncbi:DNA repair and recombination protein RadB [Candidatus Pacearchaeota archaeon]|nr:DNA repair and recombination protein RadB [Candidatus Pacearchaeota archaeon]
MGTISAGNYDLNVWLKGGYDSGIITTFYGGPGCGKTNLCMIATVSQAKKGNKVIFIDTEGGFSSERVKQLFLSKSTDSSKSDSKILSIEEVLSNILVLKPTNFKEQQESFDQLLKHINDKVSLIIVDGMTMLYRLDFADAKHNLNGLNSENSLESMQFVNAQLTRQMRLLVEIARKQMISVLVTNQIYSWNNEQRMVAGDIVKYWSKCLIELVNESGRRTAYLRKHRSLPEKSLAFQIHDGGIRKKGWL